MASLQAKPNIADHSGFALVKSKPSPNTTNNTNNSNNNNNKIPDEPVVHHTPGGDRKSTSCISLVTTKSSPRGNLSLLTTAELPPANQANLCPIPERGDSPTGSTRSTTTTTTKKTFSAGARDFFFSLGASRGPGGLLDFIRSRLRISPRPPTALPSLAAAQQKKTFEKICFELARADNSEVGSETCQILDQVDLSLKINTLAKSFTLVLPPTFNPAGLGDEEERGVGGTCDQFIGVLPPSCRKVSEKASPLGLVPKLLPYGIISKQARYVGSCFWIWLCIVDDLTEKLVGKDWDNCEADLFLAFTKNPDESLFHDRDNDAVRVSLALRNVIHSTNIRTGIVDSPEEVGWRSAFMEAVSEVLVGFREERPLLVGKTIAMLEWMRLRAITIAVRPFLILARADLGLTPSVSALGNPLDGSYESVIANNKDGDVSPLRKVECMLQLIMGLQNDILGWEKDCKQENPLSAIQVLIQNGTKPCAAMSRVVNAHNELVRRCIQHAQLVCEVPAEVPAEALAWLDYDGISSPRRSSRASIGPLSVFHLFRMQSPFREPDAPDAEKIRRYVQLVLGFANGMANWMAVSKRYLA